MNQRILKRLLWKDARTISPLVIAVLIGLAGLHLLTLVLHHSDVLGLGSRSEMSLAICVMFPMLYAFGCGAMLVGTEEETGSLSWLRTLPASWRMIATSKLMVAIGGLALVWLVSGLGFLSQRILATDILVTDATSRQAWIWGIVAQFGISLAIMLCGFLSVYLFRSPVAALLISVPIMIGLLYLFIVVIEAATPETLRHQSWSSLSSQWKFSVVCLFALGFVGLFSAVAWAARRRLAGPDRSADRRYIIDSSAEGFRPPATSWNAVSLVNRRPRPAVALLWQSMRQSFWPVLIATVVGSVSVVIAALMLPSVGWANLTPMLASIAIFTLSGMTFYGDSVRRRCEFFSDRGLSPSLVWSTRVIPPLLGVLLMGVCYFVASYSRGQEGIRTWMILVLMLASFSLCQLISQSSRRPVLAFLGAPVALYLFAAPFFPLVYSYSRELPQLLLAFLPIIPILLFASWSLTRRWMQGKLGRDYALRCVGFMLLAIAVPYALMVGGRWITAPSEDQDWVAGMKAYRFPDRDNDSRLVAVNLPLQDPLESDAYHREAVRSLLSEPREEELSNFKTELNSSSSIGLHLNAVQVYAHMTYFAKSNSDGSIGGYPPPELNELVGDDDFVAYQSKPMPEEVLQRCKERDFRGAAILLHWSKLIRREALYGSTAFDWLRFHSEKAEYQVARMLRDYVDTYGVDDQVIALVEQFPKQKTVKQSRINGLIWEWQLFNEPDYSSRVLSFSGVQSWPFWLSFERQRERVPVNRVVRGLLDKLRSTDDGYYPGSIKSSRSPQVSEASFFGDVENLMSRRDWTVFRLREELRRENEKGNQS